MKEFYDKMEKLGKIKDLTDPEIQRLGREKDLELVKKATMHIKSRAERNLIVETFIEILKVAPLTESDIRVLKFQAAMYNDRTSDLEDDELNF